LSKLFQSKLNVSQPLKKFNYPYNKPYKPKETTTTNSPPPFGTSFAQDHPRTNDLDKYEQLISSKLHDMEINNPIIAPPQYDSFKYTKIQPSKILGIYNSFQQVTPAPKLSYFNPYKYQTPQSYKTPSYFHQQNINLNKPNKEDMQLIDSVV